MGTVREKGSKMSSHSKGDIRIIVQLISFSVNQCIATVENTFQSRAWFRHISLSFVKLINNNNLVKQGFKKIRYNMFILYFVCFY